LAELPGTWRQIKGRRAFHINVKPIVGRLHLAKHDDSGGGIVFNREMIALAQAAPFADLPRNDDLAPGGHCDDHKLRIPYFGPALKVDVP
jgi:hypothetical protein